MLRMSRKMRFALEAVVDVAYNSRSEPVQSGAITRRQGIPQRYLEQIMQQLVRSGILKGVRGPRGGYHLARDRRRITVGEIVRVIGEIENNGDAASESVLGRAVIRPLIDDLQVEIMSRLDAITVQDLCNSAEGAGIERALHRRLDFTI